MTPLFAEVSPLVALGAFVAGLAIATGFFLLQNRSKLSSAQARADEIMASAGREADAVKKQSVLDAKEEALREREKMLTEVERRRNEVRDAERLVEKRESAVETRAGGLERRERTVEAAQKKAAESAEQYEKRRQMLERMLNEQREMLLKITGLDRSQAERLLLKRIDDELASEIGSRILRFEERLKSRTEEKAREILANAIQRYAAPHTADTSVSTVDIPSDDMKGRIIGRDGRNIRAFEKATGVDVIVDDTPGVVVVSGFDAVRREVGKIALERLIADGRIHPARIEEVVAECREDIENHILELGKRAALEAEVPNLNEKLVKLLGRLKFRTSYSQNVLRHSVEVALLCGLLADELGLDNDLARRCGLLHDVGKAIDHEVEGGHPKVGADVARRCGENETVLHAIAGHHDDIRVDHIYTVLVATADAISASRPGARRESLEKYVNRLRELEALACEFSGVESAYAIQAGRELRVIADSGATDDASAAKLSFDIAKAIEERLQYPGEIKVTVMRETRTVEYAR